MKTSRVINVEDIQLDPEQQLPRAVSESCSGVGLTRKRFWSSGLRKEAFPNFDQIPWRNRYPVLPLLSVTKLLIDVVGISVTQVNRKKPMINQVSTDRIDEAIDSFEEGWSLDSRSDIRSLLGRFHLADDSTAITELIRIDIELRYAQGIPIDLDEYLNEFGAFLGEPGDIAQIAFEDFRAREAYGHPVSSSRWRGLPGIDNQSWFRSLIRQQVEIVPARRSAEVDETFEAALAAIGFRLIHELGRGAFSQVFLATQNDLADRYVALKIIDQPLSEPQNMAMLQHTNIVPIYSFDRILSRSVICMPYAGRVTLADLLKSEGNVASRGGECLITTVLNNVHDTVRDAEDSPDCFDLWNGDSRSGRKRGAASAGTRPFTGLQRIGALVVSATRRSARPLALARRFAWRLKTSQRVDSQ